MKFYFASLMFVPKTGGYSTTSFVTFGIHPFEIHNKFRAENEASVLLSFQEISKREAEFADKMGMVIYRRKS